MRHATLMGAQDPVMYRLVPALTRQMGTAYAELVRAEPLISETLQLEETRFKTLLERGLTLLAAETAKLDELEQQSPAAGASVDSARTVTIGAAAPVPRASVRAVAKLPGEVAFRLYDTYGFPLDLTQDALREQGREVDLAGFEVAMAGATRPCPRGMGRLGRGRHRANLVRDQAGRWGQRVPRLQHRSRRGGNPRPGRGRRTGASAAVGKDVAVVLNQTPFYGESGGQVGDTGMISGPDGLRITVTDTQKKLGDLFVHLGRVEAGEARVGTPVVADVDHTRRTHIRAHHSATHLLHEALRRRLGTHVAQKGSLNAPDRLRFDVSHPRPITGEDIAVVEAEVNARIRENTDVVTRLMTPDAAVEMGAMALVRREIRRRGPRRDDGRARGQQAGLVDRAVRRHACPPHRRHRLFPHRRGKRGRRRRAPHRGGHRPLSPRPWLRTPSAV